MRPLALKPHQEVPQAAKLQQLNHSLARSARATQHLFSTRSPIQQDTVYESQMQHTQQNPVSLTLVQNSLEDDSAREELKAIRNGIIQAAERLEENVENETEYVRRLQEFAISVLGLIQ